MLFRILGGFTLCFLGTLIGLSLAPPENILGFKALGDSGLSLAVLFTLPLLMLLGIAAYGVKIQLNRLPSDEDEVDIRSVLSKAFRSRGFLRAVIVSPIVFASIYALVEDQPDIILSHLIAFENGFFWQAILDRRED